MTGTSTVIMAAMTRPITDARLVLFPHSVQKTFLLIGPMSSTGASLKWFKNQLGLAEQNAAALFGIDPYEVMNREVETLAAGPSGSFSCLIWPGNGRPSGIIKPEAFSLDYLLTPRERI